MKDFMAASVVHTVRVQNVLLASRSNATWTLPLATLACREERRAKNMKGRMYRQERTRKRVMETTDIRANYCTEARNLHAHALTEKLFGSNRVSPERLALLHGWLRRVAVVKSPYRWSSRQGCESSGV